MIGFILSVAMAATPIQIKTSAPKVGDVDVTVQVSDLAASRQIKTVFVEGDMSHPGMVPVTASAKKVRDGEYVAKLRLTMGGDWRVSATVEFLDGHREEQHVNLSGVK